MALCSFALSLEDSRVIARAINDAILRTPTDELPRLRALASFADALDETIAILSRANAPTIDHMA